MNSKYTTLGDNKNNKVCKGLETFIKRDKITHLGPQFVTYRERSTATTPDIVLSNMKTFHNLQIKPGPITASDHIPIIVKITADKITEPTTNTINTKKADLDTFEIETNKEME